MTTPTDTAGLVREARLDCERRILAAEVAAVKAEKAMREAAARAAETQPNCASDNQWWAIGFRDARKYIAEAIRALPLSLGRDYVRLTAPPPEGDELSTRLGERARELLAAEIEKLAGCTTTARLIRSGSDNPTHLAVLRAIETALASDTARIQEAVPVIEAEREVMLSSFLNRFGPKKGKVTDKAAKPIVARMDAALRAAATFLLSVRAGGAGDG